MAKSRKNLSDETLPQAPQKPYLVRTASLSDDFCNYSLELMVGIGAGRTAGFGDKKHIIDPDLQQAFADLNPHLAAVDNIFKHAKVKATSFEDIKGHSLSHIFDVTSIEVMGDEDNMSVHLIGTKLTDLGRFKIKSPKIILDNLSSYKWYNELKESIENVRTEVALYHEGKYTEAEADEEEEAKYKQSKLFGKDAAAGEKESGDTNTAF